MDQINLIYNSNSVVLQRCPQALVWGGGEGVMTSSKFGGIGGCGSGGGKLIFDILSRVTKAFA